MGQWDLIYNKRPWTLNSERRGTTHWTKTAALTREWRQAFCSLAIAAKVPRLHSAKIVATQFIPNWRNAPDAGACIGSAKAALDGIVDAGVLPDDNHKYVTYLGFPAPILGDKDALMISIIGRPLRGRK